MEKAKQSRMPRDEAGGFQVPATKPGNIRAMCGLPDHLEVYTPGETFKIQTPEGVDPQRTNPNAMFLNAKIHDVGSAHPYVARTILMASEMLRSQTHPSDAPARESLLVRMHSIKERLLECDTICTDLEREIGDAIKAIGQQGLPLARGGRSYERFPIVPGLEARVTTFLIAARRCLTEICQVPGTFWTLSRQHNSLDHLLKHELVGLLGTGHRLVQYLDSRAEAARLLVALRNGQEHAATTTGPKLQVRNFEMLPTNQIRPPCLYLDGDPPQELTITLRGFADFLADLAESMFVGCMDSTLTDWPPVMIQSVPAPDPECPIRYELTIDVAKLRGGQPHS